MKRILRLAAASLLACGGTADAKTKSYVISLGTPFCVVANVNVTGTQITANENDTCQTYIGAGFVGMVKKSGNRAIIGGISDQFPGNEVVINLGYPFVTGGDYAVYVTSDGVTLTKVGSGNYTVN